jgi:hypothetical protein
MKRRIGIAAASAVLAATIGTFVPASPASAHTDACVGTGTATLSVGFTATTDRTANFSFSFTAGACANKATLTATGTVTGRCGLSTGVGVTGNGHSFSFVSAGTALNLSGEVTGEVSAVADVASGSSCVSGATRFLITGSVVLRHCTVMVTNKLPGPWGSWWTNVCVA